MLVLETNDLIKQVQDYPISKIEWCHIRFSTRPVEIANCVVVVKRDLFKVLKIKKFVKNFEVGEIYPLHQLPLLKSQIS